jgi:hypothetical protein
LIRPSVALTSQVTTLNRAFLDASPMTLDPIDLARVDAGLRLVFG